jgi:uncharacterized protein (TIGR03435 family)
LLRYAFNLPDWRIAGFKEEWAYCSINARLEAPATPEDVRAMLRQLLIERFKLTTHTKVEERSGYALLIGRRGPRLQVAAVDGVPPAMPPYFSSQPLDAFAGYVVTSSEGKGVAAITGRGVPVSELADALSQQLGAFVTDKTGLNGQFYFGFTFQRSDYVNTDAAEAPNIFDAVEQELGLRLEKERGPVEFLVVDHVEKIPVEN